MEIFFQGTVSTRHNRCCPGRTHQKTFPERRCHHETDTRQRTRCLVADATTLHLQDLQDPAARRSLRTIECFQTATDKTVTTADLQEQREARRFTITRLQPFCNESSRSLSNFRLNKAQRVPFVSSLCQGSNGNVSRANAYLLLQYIIGQIIILHEKDVYQK